MPTWPRIKEIAGIAVTVIAASMLGANLSYFQVRSIFLAENWKSAELVGLGSDAQTRKLEPDQVRNVTSFLGTLPAQAHDPAGSPCIAPDYCLCFQSEGHPSTRLYCYLGFHGEAGEVFWKVGEQNYSVVLSLTECESLLRTLELRWDGMSGD